MDPRLSSTSSTMPTWAVAECTAAVRPVPASPSLPTGLTPPISALFAEICGAVPLCATSLSMLQKFRAAGSLRSDVVLNTEMDSFSMTALTPIPSGLITHHLNY